MATPPQNTRELWGIIAIASIMLWGLRSSFVVWLDPERFPAWVQRGLRFVPAAALTTLIVPALVVRQGEVAIAVDNARLWAGIAAGIAAWRGMGVLAIVGIGMGVLWGAIALGAH